MSSKKHGVIASKVNFWSTLGSSVYKEVVCELETGQNYFISLHDKDTDENIFILVKNNAIELIDVQEVTGTYLLEKLL